MKPKIDIAIYNPTSITDYLPRLWVRKSVQRRFPEAEILVTYELDGFFWRNEVSVLVSNFGSDRLNEAVETLVEHLAECACKGEEPFQ